MALWFKIGLIIVSVLLAGLFSIGFMGFLKWQATSANLIDQIKIERNERVFTYDQLDGLPAPLIRYFKHVLTEGQPLINWIRLEQTGTFRNGGFDTPWVPFNAVQYFSTNPPGLVWDARIQMAPLMNVHVRDGYVHGNGSMEGALFYVIPVVNEHDKKELNEAALQRYLAEAVWFPTALLPSDHLSWSEIDDSSALATLVDGDIEVSLQFHFNENNEVSRIYTEGRYHEKDGEYMLMPWQGHFKEYEQRRGIRTPLEGEVEWILPEGSLLYWRGRIEQIEIH